MNLLHILSYIEENDDIHLARLLILLNAFTGSDGTGTIDGLTKLAKLDFLLCYPVYLERALQAKNASTRNIDVVDYERLSVESRMVRFKYGPWDFRYRQFINLLVAKGLAEVEVEKRRIKINVTPSGIKIAKDLSEDNAFIDISRRANSLKTHFDYQGTYLMKFIYKTFPEIATMA